MPLINTLGALVSAKNVIGTIPTGLGFVASTSDFDAINYSGLTLSSDSLISNSIAIDGSSNIFIPYRIPSTAGLGDNSRGVIAKLSSTGSTVIIPTNVRDTRTISGSRQPTYYLGIALDSTDNIYGVGLGIRIVGSTPFEHTLVTKFNSAGTLQWSNLYYSGNTGQIAIDVKVDSADNVYVLTKFFGVTRSTILTKINSSGTVLWSRNFAGSPYGMTIDSSDNVIVLSVATDGYITKINSSGTRQWSVTINTVLNDIVWNNNAIYLSTLSGIIILNDSGSIINQVSLNVNLTTTRIAVDNSSNIYFSGATAGKAIYIASINSSLAIRWQNLIQVNPIITYPEVPYLSDIEIDGTSIIVSFNHYSDQIASGEIRSMYVMKVPNNGKILMRGRYVVSDNIISYTLVPSPLVTTTTFATSTGINISNVTITSTAITLTTANISQWYDTII